MPFSAPRGHNRSSHRETHARLPEFDNSYFPQEDDISEIHPIANLPCGSGTSEGCPAFDPSGGCLFLAVLSGFSLRYGLRPHVTNEAQLIEMALQGDSAAFGSLVRRYQDRLFTSMVHLVGQREEAEDIVQDAFVQALLKLSSFRQSSSFYTWLYRIAFNAAVNRRRRTRGEVPLDQTPGNYPAEPADPNDQPAERILRSERVQQIQSALKSLSEEFRAVLVLREIEGFDYDTIARVLDVSVGTVRSRLHRARALMREQLALRRL